MTASKRNIITLSLILIASFFLYPFSCSQRDVPVFGESSQSPIRSSAEAAKAVEIQKAFRDIYDIYKDRVVFIATEQTVKIPQNPFFNDPFFREFFGGPQQGPRTQRRTGLGTGFVLSDDGYICTNHHVVSGVDKVTVKINTKEYPAKIIGSDEKTDIALLKINPGEKLKPVYLGNSDDVRVGDWAIAIGNPFGLDKTFTVGVISATGRRDVDMMGGSQSHIQTDASINPGNSGGPLININGEVIGINRMIYSNSGGNLGIGFAIPMNTAKSVLEQLKTHKKIKRGYIGVQIVPLTEEYAGQIGLKSPQGALIGGLEDNGPAARAGAQVGDVVVKINDVSIKDYNMLADIVGKAPVGNTLKTTVWREGKALNLFITVGERP
ncbi:MAG TPA: trypsin-like peptidase domain-containing protein [Spirochaetota bacterium]|nr:trypsin-like peptidase domain-containing protein [Spirochaetota bacterium]OPZ39348.1 MAG: putative serine protease HtrA [Spirochaetes bacterium ADurb.BinA120]HNU90339.1 trypsin-like peptidase domain-containing protein [Spirochaetota bacterium]HPI13135.1 trypsin-like peptidase domain-containing protein [Spirochaetota bacterium]HPO46123.1 trypsin-like peptidase domain-containing protein [Spirochaetota bacterium]